MSAETVRFPRPMKRGAKVRRGPCAQILQFPAQLLGEELEGQYGWMLSNRDKWENEETGGFEHQKKLSAESAQFRKLVNEKFGWKEDSDAEKRQLIAEGRKLIEKRNRVKDWLESFGADLGALGEINPAEKALFFLFDRLHTRDLPSIA